MLSSPLGSRSVIASSGVTQWANSHWQTAGLFGLVVPPLFSILDFQVVALVSLRVEWLSCSSIATLLVVLFVVMLEVSRRLISQQSLLCELLSWHCWTVDSAVESSVAALLSVSELIPPLLLMRYRSLKTDRYPDSAETRLKNVYRSISYSSDFAPGDPHLLRSS